MAKEIFWTNASVLLLAGDRDPILVIEQTARSKIFRYLEAGGVGPPFSPLDLASFLSLETIPSDDVRDARTLYSGGKFFIEFNPNRPKSRINYSIAHEIAHTFFPDCKTEIRNRALHEEMHGNDWQLEMLCNIGAAELLMPATKIPDLLERGLSIEKLVDLRLEFEVSMEALLLRLVRTAQHPTFVFAASRTDSQKSIYRIDYAISSDPALPTLPNGTLLPEGSIVSDCTAINYTARGKETWNSSIGAANVQCVGIPAFPGHPFPRVVGFAKPVKASDSDIQKPVIVRGDATKPRGEGQKLLAFVVNDATPRWGAGFALAVRRKWPAVQEEFIRWASESTENLRLGNMHVFDLDENLMFAEMVCQRGYGQSITPRLRYAELEKCLKTIALIAKNNGSTVHMPMIGSGQAGGNWSIILELIEQLLCREGVVVTVYDLPGNKAQKNAQQSLLFSR